MTTPYSDHRKGGEPQGSDFVSDAEGKAGRARSGKGGQRAEEHGGAKVTAASGPHGLTSTAWAPLRFQGLETGRSTAGGRAEHRRRGGTSRQTAEQQRRTEVATASGPLGLGRATKAPPRFPGATAQAEEARTAEA